MERRGECNHCGWCCQFVAIQRHSLLPKVGQATVNEDHRKFLELRGAVTNPEQTVTRFVVHQFAPCSMHDDQRCKDYECRPDVCRNFPETPEQIEGTPCTFWFEDADGTMRGGGGSPYPTQPRFEV
jgi:Fe-S-cluster containining protein